MTGDSLAATKQNQILGVATRALDPAILFFYNGSEWQVSSLPDNTDPDFVFARGEDDFFVLSDDGKIFQGNGLVWELLTETPTQDEARWLAGTSEVLIVLLGEQKAVSLMVHHGQYKNSKVRRRSQFWHLTVATMYTPW